jgi:hypothetical protein
MLIESAMAKEDMVEAVEIIVCGKEGGTFRADT